MSSAMAARGVKVDISATPGTRFRSAHWASTSVMLELALQ